MIGLIARFALCMFCFNTGFDTLRAGSIVSCNDLLDLTGLLR